MGWISQKKDQGTRGGVYYGHVGTSSLWLCLQVSGVGYNGRGAVCLLPSKEVIKEFNNVSVGKLVEVSVRAPRWKQTIKRS